MNFLSLFTLPLLFLFSSSLPAMSSPARTLTSVPRMTPNKVEHPLSQLKTTDLSPEFLANLQTASSKVTVCGNEDGSIHVYNTSPLPDVVLVVRQYRGLYHVTVDGTTQSVLANTAEDVVAMLKWDSDAFSPANTGVTCADMHHALERMCFIPGVIVMITDDTAYLHIKYTGIHAEVVILNGRYVFIRSMPDRSQVCRVIPSVMDVEKQACLVFAELQIMMYEDVNKVFYDLKMKEITAAQAGLNSSILDLTAARGELDAATLRNNESNAQLAVTMNRGDGLQSALAAAMKRNDELRTELAQLA